MTMPWNKLRAARVEIARLEGAGAQYKVLYECAVAARDSLATELTLDGHELTRLQVELREAREVATEVLMIRDVLKGTNERAWELFKDLELATCELREARDEMSGLRHDLVTMTSGLAECHKSDAGCESCYIGLTTSVQVCVYCGAPVNDESLAKSRCEHRRKADIAKREDPK